MSRDMNSIESILEDLYLITGIKAGAYDLNFQPLYQHPLTMGAFCKAIRQDVQLMEKCLDCDRRGFEACRASGEITIYRCHMGLTEAIAPIIENGIPSGYLMFGQILASGDRPMVLEKIRDMDNYDFLRRKVEAMTETGNDTLRAAARLAAMCANYINLLSVIKPTAEMPEIHIRRYILNHLSDRNLSISMISSAFGISRGTLYNISVKNFGMGITPYIRSLRIGHALMLISTTNLSMYEIARLCGFADPDYLTRLIKKQTGQTPRSIRRSPAPK